jgi:alpha-L-arabinofuranosidase
MKSLQLAIAATQVLSALAVDITVASEGGNATSGHQYGFLHEVRLSFHGIGSKRC